MNKTLSTVAVVLLAGVTQVAIADHFGGKMVGDRDMRPGLHHWDGDGYRDRQVASTEAAPEISAGSLIAALSLLGGALIVLRGRSSTKPTS
jgi:hypothetical protein